MNWPEAFVIVCAAASFVAASFAAGAWIAGRRR
jgi:hypothetical protein